MFRRLFLEKNAGLIVTMIHAIAHDHFRSYDDSDAGLQRALDTSFVIGKYKNCDFSSSLAKISFDASQRDAYGFSCLQYWSCMSASPPLIGQVFQFLKQNGGVTLAAIRGSPKLYSSAVHHAANFTTPHHASHLLSEPALDETWSTIDSSYRTPLNIALWYSNRQAEWAWADRLGPQMVAVMTDDALNMVPNNYQTVLWLAIRNKCFSTLQSLLLRPGLIVNARDAVLYDDRPTVIAIFDKAAQHFAPAVLIIRDAFYSSYHLTLDLPVCTIIYHYYRVPYPRCECNPKLAASAPLKHSPYCFCFPI